MPTIRFGASSALAGASDGIQPTADTVLVGARVVRNGND